MGAGKSQAYRLHSSMMVVKSYTATRRRLAFVLIRGHGELQSHRLKASLQSLIGSVH